MKKYKRKRGGGDKPKNFLKYDLVEVFRNGRNVENGFELGLIFSNKIEHSNSTEVLYKVLLENGNEVILSECILDIRNRMNYNIEDIEKNNLIVEKLKIIFINTLKELNNEPFSNYETKMDVGKIIFSVFTKTPLNEEIANVLACNEDYKYLGNCPFNLNNNLNIQAEIPSTRTRNSIEGGSRISKKTKTKGKISKKTKTKGKISKKRRNKNKKNLTNKMTTKIKN